MFDVAFLLHDGAAPRHTIGPPPPEVTPIVVLRAKSLAHRDLTHVQRQLCAAAWVDHRLVIDPTVELASLVFHTSVQTIRQARQGRPRQQSLALGLLATGWAQSTEAERDAFVSANLLTVWDVVDRVTR